VTTTLFGKKLLRNLQRSSEDRAYHSYGMDEGGKPRRFFVPPGTSWTVTVAARGPHAAEKLAQAKAALTLLCQYGGVGAKARKGFGSFADQPGGVDLSGVNAEAAGFRTAFFGVPSAKFDPRLAASPSLELMLARPDITSGGANPWLALDQLAASAQAFAKKYKHQLPKKALGLPRKIGAPTSGQFRPGPHVKDRHSAPALYHFTRDTLGTLAARAVAFPAIELPNLADCTTLLNELLDHIRADLPARFGQYVAGSKGLIAPPTPAPGSLGPLPRQNAAGPSVPAKRKAGTLVQVVIAQKRAKGGFDVQEVGRPVGTLTLGSPAVDVDTSDGKEVTVWIHNDDPAKPQYKWPDPPKGGKK